MIIDSNTLHTYIVSKHWKWNKCWSHGSYGLRDIHLHWQWSRSDHGACCTCKLDDNNQVNGQMICNFKLNWHLNIISLCQYYSPLFKKATACEINANAKKNCMNDLDISINSVCTYYFDVSLFGWTNIYRTEMDFSWETINWVVSHK